MHPRLAENTVTAWSGTIWKSSQCSALHLGARMGDRRRGFQTGPLPGTAEALLGQTKQAVQLPFKFGVSLSLSGTPSGLWPLGAISVLDPALGPMPPALGQTLRNTHSSDRNCTHHQKCSPSPNPAPLFLSSKALGNDSSFGIGCTFAFFFFLKGTVFILMMLHYSAS